MNKSLDNLLGQFLLFMFNTFNLRDNNYYKQIFKTNLLEFLHFSLCKKDREKERKGYAVSIVGK